MLLSFSEISQELISISPGWQRGGDFAPCSHSAFPALEMQPVQRQSHSKYLGTSTILQSSGNIKVSTLEIRTICLVQESTRSIKTLTPQSELQGSPPEAAVAPKGSLFFPLCVPEQPAGRYKLPLGIFVITSYLTISALETFFWEQSGREEVPALLFLLSFLLFLPTHTFLVLGGTEPFSSTQQISFMPNPDVNS